MSNPADKVNFLTGALRLAPAMALLAAAGASGAANAAGTTAGTTINNTATATYDPGGGDVTVNSNSVSLLVDELLDVAVVSTDPGDVPVTPGATGQVTSFTVTNTGNGPEAFTLSGNGTLGGDDFDPGVTGIVLDSNGNGAYDPGVDTVYVAGSNDPLLTPDQSLTVFVLSSIPASTADGNRGEVQLSAVANTGSGAPGTSFAGQGAGGGDAVAGASGGDAVDNAFYLVQSATIAFVKSASVADPFGGSEVVPGAIVTYTLVATVSGSGTLTNVRVNDPVPAATSYQPGTLTLQGAALSDAADGDAGEVASNAVAVRLGNVSGGQTRTVTFQVRIN